jgi:hypothetical protein
VIKAAIESAIEELNAAVEDADRPSDERIEIDHDTKDLPGSPDIAAAILAKIEKAAVFVADVTPIGLSDPQGGKRQKHLANPNVLIELGYAKKALTTDRVVQVWNTAFTGCEPEDLPFDMRGKRGPISFDLPANAEKAKRDRTVSDLAKRLRSALEPILKLTRTPAVHVDRWAATEEGDISIWPTDGGKIVVNEPDHGSGVKQVSPPPRSFVRILPARWSGSDELDRHDMLIGGGGLSWGATQGGVVSYPGSVVFADTTKIHAITKRFAGTGELWGTRTDLVRKWGDYLCVRGDSVPEDWARFLGYSIPHISKGGGEFPFGVRLGVVGLDNVYWPADTGFGAKPPAALQKQLLLSYEIEDGDPEKLWDIVKDAWTKYRRVFSIPEPQVASLQQMKFFLRSTMN